LVKIGNLNPKSKEAEKRLEKGGREPQPQNKRG